MWKEVQQALKKSTDGQTEARALTSLPGVVTPGTVDELPIKLNLHIYNPFTTPWGALPGGHVFRSYSLLTK